MNMKDDIGHFRGLKPHTTEQTSTMNSWHCGYNKKKRSKKDSHAMRKQ